METYNFLNEKGPSLRSVCSYAQPWVAVIILILLSVAVVVAMKTLLIALNKTAHISRVTVQKRWPIITTEIVHYLS